MSIGINTRTYKRISARSAIPTAFIDTLETLRVQPLVWHLALRDIRLRYRRTVLGPLWTVISALIFIAALGLVSTLLFGHDVQDFLPRFTAAYFVWITIVAYVLESAVAFTAAEQVIRSMGSALLIHVQRVIIRNTIVFGHLLIVFIPLAIYLQVPVNFAAAGWWAFGIILLILNGLWVGLLTAIINTRFRDFYQLVATVLQILFFMIPIFWDPDDLLSVPWAHNILVKFNPFFMQIEAIRQPMVGDPITILNYIILFGTAVVGLMIAFVALGYAKKRIGVWL
jgi:homopolymeric O-antigen transport system permease protein